MKAWLQSLIERLTAFIFREPENRQELLTVLADAHAGGEAAPLPGACLEPRVERNNNVIID